MSNEQNSASAREIPVPPGGGSWRFDEAAWAWVSNDPAPTAHVALADQVATHTTEQEQ
jgi:hypothetical protein